MPKPLIVWTTANWKILQEMGIPDHLTCLFRNFSQFIVIHTVKGFGIVNKAEIDVFLELFCFLDDPADVGNLISGSSAFSKATLNIWKLMVHVLLKPGLENFEHLLRPQDLKRSVFIPISKKGNAKGCSNYHTIALTHMLAK